MMKRGLFLTHINQIIFRFDVGQQKMRNGKGRRRIKVCKRKKEGREKDRRKKGEGRRKKREGGWGKRREGEDGTEGDFFVLMGL